jgi:hypothetical protein
LFTAETQRSQSFFLFSFLLRGQKRKNNISSRFTKSSFFHVGGYKSQKNNFHEVDDGFHLPASQRQMKKMIISAISVSRAQRAVKKNPSDQQMLNFLL